MKLRSMRLSILAFAISVLISFTGLAQDAQQVRRLSLGYHTLKNQVRMTDEKRNQVEELEAKARKANDDKQYGEAIKHLLRGMALMRNLDWKPINALVAALRLNINKVVFDPGEPAQIKLSQIFTPDELVKNNFNISLSLFSRKNGSGKELKTFYNVKPDFVKPLVMDFTLPHSSDGDYVIELRFSNGLASSLFGKTGDEFLQEVSIHIEKGLSSKFALLKSRINSLRSSVSSNNQQLPSMGLPALDYKSSILDLVNTGQLTLARTDLKVVIADANTLLDQIAKNENPLTDKRGDIHWAYQSAVDDTLQPYRFFVPTNYDAKKKWPLVVALHGMEQNENSFFAGYNNGEIKRLAEARGFLVVCPKGRAPASMYLGVAETDVIDVIKAMKRDYSIDDDRVYLMGHSMGGYGSWSVAVNHPDLFAALGPIAGGGHPFVMMGLKKIAHIPWIVVHGDKDPTVSVEESRKMVKAGEDLGIEIKYIEVPGGDHGSIVVPAFKDIFDWFDAHKRQPKAAAKAAGSGQ